MPRQVNSGRPPKFGEPRRPVTVTLPLRTLNALNMVDQDRARAIVKCVDATLSKGQAAMPQVEIIQAFAGTGVIVIPDCPSLRRLADLRLVEIMPGRFLLAGLNGYTANRLELDISDILATSSEESGADRPLLEALLETLSKHRRKDNINTAVILLVGL